MRELSLERDADWFPQLADQRKTGNSVGCVKAVRTAVKQVE